MFAGTGTLGFIDNIEATQARLNAPRGLAVDAEGNVYIADGGNDRLRRVDLAGNITTIAGGAADSAGHGDGGAGSGVNFNNIQGIYTGPDDALYVVDSGHRNVRRVEKQNPFNTTTYMTGTGCVTTGVLAYLDIGSSGLTWDELGRAYFAATVQRNGVVCPLVDFNGQHALLRRELNGTLTYLSGTITNNATTNGDGQTGSETFWQPLTGDLFFDGDDLVFANGSDHRLRKITGVKDVVAGTTTGSTGTVTTIIGTRGSAGFSPLTLPGTELLNRPISLVRHPITGDIYIADTNNHSIRMLVP